MKVQTSPWFKGKTQRQYFRASFKISKAHVRSTDKTQWFWKFLIQKNSHKSKAFWLERGHNYLGFREPSKAFWVWGMFHDMRLLQFLPQLPITAKLNVLLWLHYNFLHLPATLPNSECVKRIFPKPGKRSFLAQKAKAGTLKG